MANTGLHYKLYELQNVESLVFLEQSWPIYQYSLSSPDIPIDWIFFARRHYFFIAFFRKTDELKKAEVNPKHKSDRPIFCY